MYGTKLQYIFYSNKCNISFEVFLFELELIYYKGFDYLHFKRTILIMKFTFIGLNCWITTILICLFITKFELTKLITEEHEFHDRFITLFTSENNRVLLPNFTVPSCNKCFYINKWFISFELSSFEFITELLIYICLFTLYTYNFIMKITFFGFELQNNILECVYSLLDII
jgi:hypothetical protein